MQRLTLTVFLLCLIVAVSSAALESGTTAETSNDSGSGSGSGGSGSDSSSSGDDHIPIAGLHDLVNGLVNGSLHQMPGNKDVAIALQNTNEVHKYGVDADPEKEHQKRVEVIQKKSEAALKEDMEETHKTTSEEVRKKTLMKKRTISHEERQKKFDDELRQETFKHEKKKAEANAKAEEQSRKQMHVVKKEEEASKNTLKRDKALAQAQYQAKEATAKAKHQMAREKMNEDTHKKDKEAKRKRDEAERKFQKESMHKTKREKRTKEHNTKSLQRKQEKHKKRMAKKMERQAKASKRVHERQVKKKRAHAMGRWCKCRAERVRFDKNKHWNMCSGNKFITGFYRGSHHNLANIYYFRCCEACRDDGRTVMKAEACRNANWVASFDRRGWSHCPSRTYLKGLYKSSCNWLYCLEYAHCCRIHGSRGPARCSHTKHWWSSLDRKGWSIAHGNKLITGLYRNNCHALYCLEMAHNCQWHAY